jgi:type IV pilus assembly protein PilB
MTQLTIAGSEKTDPRIATEGAAPGRDQTDSTPQRPESPRVESLIEEKLRVPTIDLSLYLIEDEVARMVPEEVARRRTLIPVFKIERNLTVAMADPADVFAIDEVESTTGCRVEPVKATESEIEKTLDQFFGLHSPQGGDRVETEEEVSSTALVNDILSRAIKDGASDIHIEPEEDYVSIRNRVDGLLALKMRLPKAAEPALVTRIKILSRLDIAEKRLPQDGRIQMKSEGKDIDIRVSVQPTVDGENVVMRILDRSSILLGLENLGLDPERLQAFDAAVTKPYGMVLVTGPTGSGKTTTLYSVLNRISSPELNIMTIEDPVEYRLEGIRQTQVNNVAGYTFANGLRALLRQDPDVIMVGEIRDRETAEIAVRAALTGHLVFSTLHTNDAPGAFTRLVDMGIEPFLIASSVHCVLAQRLVRKICERCKRPDDPSPYLLERLGADRSDEYRFGKGCRICHRTGYRGRTGLFELLVSSTAIRQAVLEKASTDAVRKISQEEGMTSLRSDGLVKAAAGETTLEEVLRVTAAGNEAAAG